MTNGEVFERMFPNIHRFGTVLVDGNENIIATNINITWWHMDCDCNTKLKGKWIEWTDDRKDYVSCSCCGYGDEGEVYISERTPYCPVCGSDMRGE